MAGKFLNTVSSYVKDSDKNSVANRDGIPSRGNPNMNNEIY